jgi:hypothetical protein
MTMTNAFTFLADLAEALCLAAFLGAIAGAGLGFSV